MSAVVFINCAVARESTLRNVVFARLYKYNISESPTTATISPSLNVGFVYVFGGVVTSVVNVYLVQSIVAIVAVVGFA